MRILQGICFALILVVYVLVCRALNAQPVPPPPCEQQLQQELDRFTTLQMVLFGHAQQQLLALQKQLQDLILERDGLKVKLDQLDKATKEAQEGEAHAPTTP